MQDTAPVHAQLELFADLARLHRAGLGLLNENSTNDSVQAVAQFLAGYAFEHQGSSPSYAPIACDVVQTLGREPGFWKNPDLPRRVWDAFCEKLQQLPGIAHSNPKGNPLCYQGFAYSTKQGAGYTSGPSVIQFIQRNLKDYGFNIVGWAQSELRSDHALAAHQGLSSIQGIGPKIASLFLRDVAWYKEIEVIDHRALLQPLDGWVLQAVYCLDPTAKDKEAEWIIQKSLAIGIVPEAVNAGMWYFGALIARSKYELAKVLPSPEHARRLADEHVRRLDQQVQAWSQSE